MPGVFCVMLRSNLGPPNDIMGEILLSSVWVIFTFIFIVKYCGKTKPKAVTYEPLNYQVGAKGTKNELTTNCRSYVDSSRHLF